MASTSSRNFNGTGSINASQPRVLNLLDVLRQLAVGAVDCILDKLGRDGFSNARLACKALRDFVDANICDANLSFAWTDAMNLRSFTSPLARFRRCSCLSIMFWKGKEAAAHDVIQHPSLLASLCVAGVGADVARNITELCLEGPLELPTLVTVALVLAGTLQQVRILTLDTWSHGMGDYGFNNMHALHIALRGAFPALEELKLPARACLRGLEAFAGSRLHTVRVMAESPRPLRMSHARSLVQLPQLRQLDLAGGDWDAGSDGDDYTWDDEEADSPVGAAELPPGHPSDEEAFREMEKEQVQEVWALRRLLMSPPAALERLRCDCVTPAEVGFAGGRITCVELSGHCAADLRRAAAVLLPVLAATGRRLPLLKVGHLAGHPVHITCLLLPHTPFARLLAVTDRVELGTLSTVDGTAADAAVALQVMVRAVGGLPEELWFGPYDALKLDLQTRPRYLGGAGGDRHAAGGAATAAAPAAVAEVTAQQVLERAAARMWDTAEAEAAATVAGAEARKAANAAYFSWSLHDRLVLLRGPLVWQLTCGPDGAGGGGAARLKEWLESSVARPPPPATAAAAGATSGIQTDAAASDSDGVEVWRCSVAACGSGSALAVAECGDSIAALRLYHAAVAAAAAASGAPGCLQVSVCKEGADGDWTPVIHAVIRELWEDHRRSAPLLAMPTGMAAAAGQGLTARGAPEAGVERPGQAAADQVGAAAGQGEAVAGRGGVAAWECDLQVLQRLLLLAEQARKAVGNCN